MFLLNNPYFLMIQSASTRCKATRCDMEPWKGSKWEISWDILIQDGSCIYIYVCVCLYKMFKYVFMGNDRNVIGIMLMMNPYIFFGGPRSIWAYIGVFRIGR